MVTKKFLKAKFDCILVCLQNLKDGLNLFQNYFLSWLFELEKSNLFLSVFPNFEMIWVRNMNKSWTSVWMTDLNFKPLTDFNRQGSKVWPKGKDMVSREEKNIENDSIIFSLFTWFFLPTCTIIASESAIAQWLKIVN